MEGAKRITNYLKTRTTISRLNITVLLNSSEARYRSVALVVLINIEQRGCSGERRGKVSSIDDHDDGDYDLIAKCIIEFCVPIPLISRELIAKETDDDVVAQ